MAAHASKVEGFSSPVPLLFRDLPRPSGPFWVTGVPHAHQSSSKIRSPAKRNKLRILARGVEVEKNGCSPCRSMGLLTRCADHEDASPSVRIASIQVLLQVHGAQKWQLKPGLRATRDQKLWYQFRDPNKPNIFEHEAPACKARRVGDCP